MVSDSTAYPAIFVTLYIVVATLITVINLVTLKILYGQQKAIARKYRRTFVRKGSIVPSFLVATLSSIMIPIPYFKDSASLIDPFPRKTKKSSSTVITNNYGAPTFLMSLSLAYLIRGAGMVPLFIIVTFFGEKFGPLKKCDYYLAVTFFNNLTGYCCAYSQLGIAIDRFRAIVTPFKRSFTPNQCRTAIALIWIMSVCAAIPAFLVLYSRRSLMNLVFNPGAAPKLFCQFTREEHLLIISLQISIGCGFPVLACCILYSIVIARLWSGGMGKAAAENRSISSVTPNMDSMKKYSIKRLRRKNLPNVRLATPHSENECEPLTFANGKGHRKSNSLNIKSSDRARKFNTVSFATSHQRSKLEPGVTPTTSSLAKRPLSSSSLRRNRNAIKMVIIILILYTLCSIPFYIMTILEISFKDIKLSFTVEHLHNILIMTDHWLHVAVYLYFNNSFRQGFIDTLCSPALLDCAMSILPQACVRALLRNRKSARGRRSTGEGESIANTNALNVRRGNNGIASSSCVISTNQSLTLGHDPYDFSNSIEIVPLSGSSYVSEKVDKKDKANNSLHPLSFKYTGGDSSKLSPADGNKRSEKSLTLSTNTVTHRL